MKPEEQLEVLRALQAATAGDVSPTIVDARAASVAEFYGNQPRNEGEGDA